MQEKNEICFTDVLWNTSYLFKICVQVGQDVWVEQLTVIFLEESHISLLPITDLHATDPSALYLLLLFATDQGKIVNVDMLCVRFDQQHYVCLQWKWGFLLALGASISWWAFMVQSENWWKEVYQGQHLKPYTHLLQ